MTLIISVLFALAAIASTPNVEPTKFVENVIGHCRPVEQRGVIGCEAPPPNQFFDQFEDETDYAVWTIDGPQVGP